MTVTAPPLTTDQRRDALTEGNRIRLVRAEVKRALRAELPSVAAAIAHEIITRPKPDLLTMRVEDLLLAAPKLGSVKVNRLMRRAQVSPSKTLGGLTERQRRALRDELGRVER